MSFLRSLYRHAVEKSKYAAAFIAKNNPPAKFIIFAQGRTGTNLLRDLLNSHPKIHCDGELLKHKKIFLKSFLEIRRLFFKTKAYGFKVKIYQLTKKQKIHNPKQIMSDLHRRGWKIIYLKRRNLFCHAVSTIAMEHRRKERFLRRSYTRWFKDCPISIGKIHINCTDLIKKMKYRENLLAQEETILHGLPHMQLVYEDNLLKSQDHQNTANRIFGYLNLPFFPVTTQRTKKVPERLSDLIDNFEEIANAVGKTRYAKFL